MIKRFLDRVPAFFKSFYFISTLFFVVWISFIDSNDIFLQFRLSAKERELRQEKEYYEEQILQVKNNREALLNDPFLLEKLAREKYLMKRPNEDLFIVVDREEI